MSKNLHVIPQASEPTAEIYKVTPAVAKRWLSRNVRNRPIRPGEVAKWVREMKAGAWMLTGEAIKFDTNGALADGQHRLTAVIESGVTVNMLVVRGLAPEAQALMDSGAKRTASDSLTFKGVKNSSIVAAAARLAYREPDAGYVAERIANPTNSEVGKFVEDFPQIVRAAEMSNHFYPAFDAPPSVLALAWMRFEDAAGAFAAGEFFESIANMTTDGPGDPRLALIRRLATARRNSERLEPKTYLSLIFRAWNAWRKGASLQKMAPRTQGGNLVGIPKQVAS